MSLEQIASRITSGGTPTSGSPRYYGEHGGLPFAKTEDLTRARSKFIENCELEISAAALKETAAKRYPTGTILISMYGTIGLTRIAAMELAANQALCALIPPLTCCPDYLYHHLDYIRPQWLKHSGQTTQANINGAAVRRHEVPIPSVSEQRKIAHVLDTLDTAIDETEAIIDKLKAVKQGLLHDLLTRGIDANGELRPPQAKEPHLYKESPLGRIPKEWTYKPFGGLCESSAFGPRFPSDAYDENGPLATLRTTDMDEEGNISLSTMPRAAIAPSVFADHLLRPGDIVISRSGTCGVTGVFTGHDIPVVPGAFLIRFRMRDLRLNRFYRRYFNSSQGRPYLERLAVGGVQKNIKGSDVLCLLVPVPAPEEAKGIAERIECIEQDIEGNQQLLTKLTLQKSGLMDDLLTGRVRVTPLLDEAEPQGECA